MSRGDEFVATSSMASANLLFWFNFLASKILLTGDPSARYQSPPLIASVHESLPLARVSQEGVGLHRSEPVCFQSDLLFTSFWFQALC
ncbi:hypothetical protein MHYP_G00264160 [Metynnis hypsauchen]